MQKKRLMPKLKIRNVKDILKNVLVPIVFFCQYNRSQWETKLFGYQRSSKYLQTPSKYHLLRCTEEENKLNNGSAGAPTLSQMGNLESKYRSHSAILFSFGNMTKNSNIF